MTALTPLPAATASVDTGCECGLCGSCVRRLPLALVRLMAQSRDVAPVVFDTAVACAGLWLRAHPVAPRRGGDSPIASPGGQTCILGELGAGGDPR